MYSFELCVCVCVCLLCVCVCENEREKYILPMFTWQVCFSPVLLIVIACQIQAIKLNPLRYGLLQYISQQPYRIHNNDIMYNNHCFWFILNKHSCLTVITLNKKQQQCMFRIYKDISPQVPITASIEVDPAQMADIWFIMTHMTHIAAGQGIQTASVTALQSTNY